MSSDRITTEQRRSIFENGVTFGDSRGARRSINQLTALMGPDITHKITVYALGIVLDASEEKPSQRVRFEKIDWLSKEVVTLGDLHLLTTEELAATQPTPAQGEVFAQAVSSALSTFNIRD